MLESHEIFDIPDENKNHNLQIEVNWNPTDPKTNECKVIKVIHPDGKESYIKKDYFFSVLFAIGTSEEQRKAVPQTVTKSKWYETVLSVKATKDIAKGESIVFPIKISLPDERREAIAELKREMANGHVPIT